MLNKAILMGRLTRAPELRRVNDTSVVNFTLAINRPHKDANGNYPTDFIDVIVWGKRADWCTNWLDKGSMVIVCGSIQSRNWTDKQGNHRVSIEVKADEVTFGETKAARELAQQSTNSNTTDFQEISDDEDDGETPS